MKIAVNVIGSSKYADRINLLSCGGLRFKKHDVCVNVLGEGLKPNCVPSDWNWLDWSHIRVADRHIHMIANHGLDDGYDFHLFCDDDSATNIDHMVNYALSTCSQDTSCIWTPALGEICHQHWFDALQRSVQNLMPRKERNSLWIGYEAALVNNKLASLMNKSELAKRVFDFSSYLDGSTTASNTPCDIQISVLAWLLDAKHVGQSKSMAHQHPHYLDYSGLINSGSLWHIHGVGRSETHNKKNIGRALVSGPFANKEELVGHLFPKLHFGIKAKSIIDKEYDLGMFFAPWTGGSMINAKLPVKFSCSEKNHGDVFWNNVLSKWQSCDDGFLVETDGDVYKFCWQMSGGYVGYLYKTCNYNTTKVSTMMCLFFK
jgi:hypothetical protein